MGLLDLHESESLIIMGLQHGFKPFRSDPSFAPQCPVSEETWRRRHLVEFEFWLMKTPFSRHVHVALRLHLSAYFQGSSSVITVN